MSCLKINQVINDSEINDLVCLCTSLCTVFGDKFRCVGLVPADVHRVSVITNSTYFDVLKALVLVVFAGYN